MPISTIGQNGLQQSRILTAVQQPAGAVLQVVQGYLGGTAVWSTTSSTPSDIGLSATITPTFATSRVLVIVQITQINSTGGNATGGAFRLLKNGTTVVAFESATGYSTATNETDCYVAGSGTSYLDSPATTSALTYKIQGWRSNGSNTIRLHPAGDGYSTIILMEIAT